MSVTGTVKNGVIELPPDVQLEEGQRVEIVPVSLSPDEAVVLRETTLAASPASPHRVSPAPTTPLWQSRGRSSSATPDATPWIGREFDFEAQSKPDPV